MNELLEAFYVAEKLRGVNIKKSIVNKKDMYVVKYYKFYFFITEDTVELETYVDFAPKIVKYFQTDTNTVTVNVLFESRDGGRSNIKVKDTGENFYKFLIELESRISKFIEGEF